MPEHTDIAIIGAGIAGPALALFLEQAGITSTIYESSPRSSTVGGGLQIAPNGMKVLERLGLDEALIEKGAVNTGARFRNERGVLLSNVEYQDPERYGHVAVNTKRAAVHRILLDEVTRRGIRICFEKRLTTLTDVDRAPLCAFDDGTEVRCRIAIGADGIHSRVREILLPDAPKPVYTGLITAGGFVSPSVLDPATLPHRQRLEMIFGRYGFFGYGYAGRSTIMWWNAVPDEEISRERLSTISDDGIRAWLLDVHRGWCAPVETIIRNSASSIYIGNIHDVPSLPAWSRGRVAIMGDAAHAVSPHSGQGASMALEDCAVLAAVLRKNIGEPEAAFALFETRRRARVEKVVQYGRRSGNQKRKLGPVGAWLRDRFVALALPSMIRRSAEWMYRCEVDP